MWIEKEDGRKVEIRRLYCELEIVSRGYTLSGLTRECDDYCKRHNLRQRFARGCIGQFVRCETDFSIRKLEIFCDVLGWRRDIRILTEIYELPPLEQRGYGKVIYGNRNGVIRDYERR